MLPPVVCFLRERAGGRMTVRSYLFSGLRLTSEIELPEWRPFEVPDRFAAPDVVIAAGVKRIRPEVTERFHQVGPDEYHFFVPDIGEYRVRSGREVLVVRTPGAGDRDIRLFILGSVLGALFYQRGLLALHASVVRTPAGAVAFCGAGGAGKSTLAASLYAGGFQFVADDLCRFDIDADGHVLAHPSTPRLKLWKDALAKLGHEASALERDYRRADKFHLAVVHRNPSAAVRVHAMYVLAWGDTRIEPLRGLSGLKELVTSASYRPDLLAHLEQKAAHWQRCTALARQLPLYRFARPMDVAHMDDALNLLQTHVITHIGAPAPMLP
jgi:hypothetical protein